MCTLRAYFATGIVGEGAGVALDAAGAGDGAFIGRAGAAPMHAVSVIGIATASAPRAKRFARTSESVKTMSPC